MPPVSRHAALPLRRLRQRTHRHLPRQARQARRVTPGDTLHPNPNPNPKLDASRQANPAPYTLHTCNLQPATYNLQPATCSLVTPPTLLTTHHSPLPTLTPTLTPTPYCPQVLDAFIGLLYPTGNVTPGPDYANSNPNPNPDLTPDPNPDLTPDPNPNPNPNPDPNPNPNPNPNQVWTTALVTCCPHAAHSRCSQPATQRSR